MTNFYALLIGIDYYEPKPDNYDHLRGCVRDIDKVADYLEKSLKIPTEQITRLTSPLPADKNSTADARSARKEMPPTYKNIVKAFNDVTKTAQAQDLVYIHYSGHGGRVKTIFPELKGEGQFDEGLVPMDVGDKGYYLRDVEMATLLKRMVDKGLIVTVIFDSCHSGGATRGDGAIRGSRNGEPDTKDRPTDSAVASREDLVQNHLLLTQGYKKEGWLPNQRNYVLLGACRPTEFAAESAFDGKDRNGALTYWMLDTLNAVPNSLNSLTYQALYDSVKGQICSTCTNQLPMLSGEGDRLVFGSEIKAVQYTLTVRKVEPEQEKVTLNGGLAEGLSRGERFALYPVGSDFTDKQKRLAVVEITDLQASTATAKILTAEESGVSAVIEKIKPGLPAVMESAPVDLKHRVRLFIKEVGDGDNQLPSEWVDKQEAALEKVRQAMQGNGWLREVQGNEEEAHYQVAVGKKGEYEICMGIPIQNLTPALSIDDADAPAEVVKRLVHLGKYHSVQRLDNPASKLTSFLEFKLLDLDKQPFLDASKIVLKENESVYLRVKNTSAQSLNVAILELESTWEISQIPIEGIQSPFHELATQQEKDIPIHFVIPQREGYEQAKEILKLFATRGEANFQWLTLPSLDQQIQSRGNLNQELENKIEEMRSRGLEPSINPLNNLLTSLGADVDDPPQVFRKAVVEYDPNADWVTKQIQFTVER